LVLFLELPVVPGIMFIDSVGGPYGGFALLLKGALCSVRKFRMCVALRRVLARQVSLFGGPKQRGMRAVARLEE